MQIKSKRRVVVIDDQNKNLQLAAHVLNPIYELVLVNSGVKALNLVKSKMPDLILLDIMMPELSGYDVCKLLKEDEETRHIPIIFLTAKTTEEDITRAYDVGGVDYVTKPFRPKELLARINAQISLKDEIEKNNRLNEQLQKTNDQKDKLLSIISHDLRGTAGQIDSLLTLLIRDYEIGGTPDEIIQIQLKALKKVSSGGRELLEDLLLWSRNQVNQINFEPEVLNVFRTINHVIKQVSGIASTKGITIKNECSEEVEVFADKNMLQTIIRNLLANSIKFSNKGKEVVVYCKKENGFVTFYVKDEGIGMNEDTLHNLFSINKMTSERGTEGEAGTGL
ncbi:MAG: hybrid sensor histidine kinase/response regulator, partial [Cyclobacteriaceae bacterium]|nr:hybrid sensor histidine kinase/response regulator [Cyclobacteriaceae bacterium]